MMLSYLLPLREKLYVFVAKVTHVLTLQLFVGEEERDLWCLELHSLGFLTPVLVGSARADSLYFP